MSRANLPIACVFLVLVLTSVAGAQNQQQTPQALALQALNELIRHRTAVGGTPDVQTPQRILDRVARDPSRAAGVLDTLGIPYEAPAPIPPTPAEVVGRFRFPGLEEIDALRPRAEQGDVDAQVILADVYRFGRGVPQDYEETARLWRLAAEQGNVDALFNFAMSYRNGHGVPQDYVLAHMWFNLSASRLHPVNAYLLRLGAVQAREELENVMTREDLSEAQRLAREWDAAHPRDP